VKEATSEAGLATAGDCYSSTAFTLTGGRFGFITWNGVSAVGNLTIKSDADHNGSFETTELVETFSLAPGYRVADTLTYDNNGNLTYDGIQAYTYDAWNRLRTVAHAYRDGSGVHSGQVFATGRGLRGRRRRVVHQSLQKIL
jgi:hypothetical protein